MAVETLSKTFGSKTKAQEILLLLNDHKEVIRQGFYQEELIKIGEFCRENNLFLVSSKFKVQLEGEDYSNKGLRIPLGDKRPGMYFLYFSKDEYKAYLASYLELIGSEKALGLLLGYPECCVDYFLQNFSVSNCDLQLKPTNMFTNLSKRSEDCVLLSHFPCNSDCEESVKLGKEYLEVLKKVDKERAKEVERVLG